MDIAKQLSHIPLFQGLEPQYLQTLARMAIKKFFKRGETVFAEGDPGTGFHIITTGRVKVYKTSPDGKEQILHIMSQGEPFGEVPVFTGQRFPAYADALTDTSTLFIPRDDFINLIRTEPSVALSMLSVLSQRLKGFTVLIEDLSLREVPARLAAYLLYISERNQGADDINLDISKTQLAGILGTIPETLSRILARMTKEEIIESDDKRHIRICDRTAVEELAAGQRRLA
ncbi:MAG: Crp/Fnr family transcriptional regulator [Deltaproteobacteria bacterium]|nr:Crp/Fnr family transcriptional regulator [Deltaproteobacteria bacterium]